MRVETGLTAEGARSHIDASLAAAGASLASEAGLGGCRGELYVHLMGQGKAKQKALEAARCLLPGMNIKIIRVSTKQTQLSSKYTPNPKP